MQKKSAYSPYAPHTPYSIRFYPAALFAISFVFDRGKLQLIDTKLAVVTFKLSNEVAGFLFGYGMSACIRANGIR